MYIKSVQILLIKNCNPNKIVLDFIFGAIIQRTVFSNLVVKFEDFEMSAIDYVDFHDIGFG